MKIFAVNPSDSQEWYDSMREGYDSMRKEILQEEKLLNNYTIDASPVIHSTQYNSPARKLTSKWKPVFTPPWIPMPKKFTLDKFEMSTSVECMYHAKITNLMLPQDTKPPSISAIEDTIFRKLYPDRDKLGFEIENIQTQNVTRWYYFDIIKNRPSSAKFKDAYWEFRPTEQTVHDFPATTRWRVLIHYK